MGQIGRDFDLFKKSKAGFSSAEMSMWNQEMQSTANKLPAIPGQKTSTSS